MSSLRLWGAALVDAAGRFSEPSLPSSSSSCSSCSPYSSSPLGAPDRLRSASEQFADERRRVCEARSRDGERLGRGLQLTVDGFAEADARLAGALAAGPATRGAVAG
jgi:hypothetical protein